MATQVFGRVTGTQDGTTEIGGLGDSTVVDANPGGLDPQYLAYSNGEVFFSGSDANNYTGLWETNGTAQGTTEIGGLGGTGITGANPAGLNPQLLTAFGNEILFAGSDADDLTGLWETNVLTGATTEIGGLHDQNVTGAYNLGLSPSAIAVLNGEALFVGVDNTMHIGLWETDGTTGGTQEIGGLGNDGISGEDTGNEGLDPSELTVFGNYVLFNGADAAGQTHIGLWITDGTAQDTKEIGGVNDAGVTGASSDGLNPVNITAFGSVALFLGTDAAGHPGLWKTDGTASGTIEIGGIGNAGVAGTNGLGLAPRDIAVFGNEAFFESDQGPGGLWVTDGTAAGTREISVSGASSTGLYPTDLTSLTTPTPNDFTGDGEADMLWRNSNGQLAEWLMNGATISASQTPTYQGNAVLPGSSWSVAGIGDFNDDGRADILWRNSNGQLAEWLMFGSTILSSASPTYQGSAVSPDSSWSVAGIGDFTGNGDDDILWRQSSGALALWLMNGSTITSSQTVTYQGSPVNPDSSWSVAGIYDSGSFGIVLWRQNTTGDLVGWAMEGGTILGTGNATYQGQPVSPDPSWSLVGLGDFSGDGQTDYLWRNSNGTLAMWLMDGSTIQSSATPTYQGSAVSPDSSWNIVEIGDFNGSGNSDILWQQSTTGALVEWQMNGSQIVSSQSITSQGSAVAPPSTWKVQAKPTDFA